MAETIEFGIRLTADGSGFVGNVQIARSEIEKLGRAGRTAADGLRESDRAMKESLTSAVALGTAIGKFATDAVQAMSRWVASTVTGRAALKDLSDITGSSVEDLSRLTNVAKISGVEQGRLSQVLERLSVGLSGTDEASKGAGKALAALGIQSRDPAKAMEELAKKFATYADDANKAAYANAIFGRGGAQLLPLLKDLAEQQDVLATVSTKQAHEAEQLEKGLRALGVQAGALRDSFLNDLVPAVNDLLEQFTKGIAIAGGFWQALNLFSTLPVIRTVAEGQEAIAQVQRDLASDEEKVSTSFGKWLNTIIGVPIEKARANAQAKIDFIKLQMEQARRAMAAADTEFGDLEGAMARAAGKKGTIGAPPSTGGRATKEIDDYTKALQGMQREIGLAQDKLDNLFAGTTQTDAARKLIALMNDPAWAKFTAQQKENIKWEAATADYLERRTESQKKAIAADIAGAKAMEESRNRFIEAQARTAQGIADTIAALDAETKTMFLSDNERERAIALLKLEQDFKRGLIPTTEALTRAQEELGAAFDRRNNAAAVKKGLDDQAAAFKKAYDDISQTITDALMRGFEGGKDWAENFIQTLKNMFGTLILRPIIQAVMAPIAGGITSLLSGGAAASGGGGGLSLGNLGGFGSLLSGSGVLGGGFGAALGAGYGAGIETLGLAMSAGAGSVGGVGSVLGAGLAVAGPWIAAAFAAYAIYKYFAGKGGGPRAQGFAQTPGFGGSAEMFGYRTGQLDPQLNAIIEPFIASTKTSYNDLIKALGGSKSTFGAAIGIDTDPRGTAQGGLGVQASVNGRVVYTSDPKLLGDAIARGPEAMQAALKLEASRALLAALQASDLPASIAKVLNTLTANTATTEQIDKVLAFASAMGQVVQAISGNVVEEAQKAWDKSQQSSVESLREMGAEVIKLSEATDGSTESMQALAVATGNYRQAVVAALLAIKQVQEQLKQTFAATREQIEFAGLTPEQAYNLNRTKAANALKQIGETDDPQVIKQLGEKVNGYFLAAWNLLSPEEQLLHKGEFLTALTNIDTSISNRLTDIGNVIGTDTAGPFAAAQKALDDAAGKFQKAADTQSAAADKTDAAVTTLATAANTIMAAALVPVRVQLDDRNLMLGGG